MCTLAGGEERNSPDWERSLINLVALARAGAAVSRQAVRHILQQGQGPIMIDSQEGDVQCEEVPVRIIGQILHRILRTCTTPEED